MPLAVVAVVGLVGLEGETTRRALWIESAREAALLVRVASCLNVDAEVESLDISEARIALLLLMCRRAPPRRTSGLPSRSGEGVPDETAALGTLLLVNWPPDGWC